MLFTNVVVSVSVIAIAIAVGSLFPGHLVLTNSTVIRLQSSTTVLPDHDKPWARRVHMCQVLPVNFIFEITTQFHSPLGLNLKPLHFMHTTANQHGTKYYAVLLVVEATSFLAQVVLPGDLLLKVNEIELCSEADVFDFDSCTRAIMTAKGSRTLRFFRPNGSASHSLSVAELRLAVSPEAVPR